jgi:hypothetical protein
MSISGSLYLISLIFSLRFISKFITILVFYSKESYFFNENENRFKTIKLLFFLNQQLFNIL